ncbi:hypothetical protein [Salinithrix halophila]|uniref:Uncharacterized protein n=1 Tax=Salinithrix halophila TaxID=1485204 RepID=A0ABV8JC95_9BACL
MEKEGKVTLTKASTIDFNSLANEIARMAEEKRITEEQLREDLKQVRKELWSVRFPVVIRIQPHPYRPGISNHRRTVPKSSSRVGASFELIGL